MGSSGQSAWILPGVNSQKSLARDVTPPRDPALDAVTASPPGGSGMILKTTWPDIRRRSVCPHSSTKSGKGYRADRRDCALSPQGARLTPAPPIPPGADRNQSCGQPARTAQTRNLGDDTRYRWRGEGADIMARMLPGLASSIRNGLENTQVSGPADSRGDEPQEAGRSRTVYLVNHRKSNRSPNFSISLT